MEYNIRFFISNKQHIANPALQQATMTALCEISHHFVSDVHLFDGTNNPITNFTTTKATATFQSTTVLSEAKETPSTNNNLQQSAG
jgi:hypothetical protein